MSFNGNVYGFNGEGIEYGIYGWGGNSRSLPKWLKDAGCTFAINVDRQVKAQENPNSPLVNPLEDVGYPKKFNITQSIVNGNFENGTNGWTLGSGATFDSVNKKIDFNTASPCLLSRLNSYNPQKYVLVFDCEIKSGTTGSITALFRLDSTNIIEFPFTISNGKKVVMVTLGSVADRIVFVRGTAGDRVISITNIAVIPLSGTPLENYSTDKIPTSITQYFEGTKEISAKLTALLQSFAGTTADGYTQIALPNGKTPWFLKFDSTDSLGIMANTADVDILGTNDFAYSLVFRTPSVIADGRWIIIKNLDLASPVQYGIYLTGTKAFLRLESTDIDLGACVANTLYEIFIVRIGQVLTVKLNKIKTYDFANSVSLTSRPNLRIGARSNVAGGTSHTGFTDINLGVLAIFYNGASGLDIAKVEKAVAKLNANYI